MNINIDPGAEMIDVQDLVEYVEEYESEREAGEEMDEYATELYEAIKALEADFWCDLNEVARNEPTMIHENYFEQYAQDLAEDIGAIDPNMGMGWPLYHIDWEAAAESLKMDYSEVTFGRHTYLIRNW